MKIKITTLKLIATCSLLLFTVSFFAQDSIRISGTLKHNTKFAKVVVKKFGIGTRDIAAFPIKNEKFNIMASKNMEPGVYRFQYSQSENNGYVDVIIDGKEKEIDFTLDVATPISQPVFSKSEENKKWYYYQNESQKKAQKISILNQFINQYPEPKEAIVEQAKKAYEKQTKEFQSNAILFLSQNRNTWVAQMVENRPVYFTNPSEDVLIQEYNQKNNYWKGINTSNSLLINTPLYTEHILNYLKYYMNPEMHFSETEMEEGFKKSVDTIMQKFSGNETTKKFALQYLQLGFKEIGNEKVLQYIDEKYKEVAEQCNVATTDKTDFEKRMAGYAAMKVGNKAPNILFTTRTESLYEIAAERTVVVFWASWCPHCQEELPKLNEWAKANPSTKVIAISLDEDKVAYETAIKQYPAIIHDTDLKKWEGKAVKDYFIYGTPTFIILDKEKKILEKLSSFEQLKPFLEEKTN